MQPMNPGTPTTGGSPATYRLVGRFLEACDCYAICPCWIDEPPDEGKCSGLYAWDIGDGQINGYEVGGLRVAGCGLPVCRSTKATGRAHDNASFCSWTSAPTTSNARRSPRPSAVGSADRLASSARCSVHWWTCGRPGSRSTGTRPDPSVRIGKSVSVSMKPKVGPSGRTTALVDSAMSSTLGPHAQVGLSTELRLALGEEGMDIEVRERSANLGWFSYTA